MIEKTLWREDFRNLPDWPCPKCRNGRLYLVDGSLRTEETRASKSAHEHEAFEASWMEGRFSAHLQCSDKECGEGAVVVGAVRYEEDFDYDHEGRTVSDIAEIYYPELIHPSPCVIDLPPEVPDQVEAEIRRASALVWIDTASSANKLRLAAERLLTAKGVKRFTINAKRKKSYIKLHDRIGLLPQKYQDIANLLHSIRILGNHGSHEGLEAVARSDLLDAFEIIEHVVDLAFSQRAKRVLKAAKGIASRKGRPSKSASRV